MQMNRISLNVVFLCAIGIFLFFIFTVLYPSKNYDATVSSATEEDFTIKKMKSFNAIKDNLARAPTCFGKENHCLTLFCAGWASINFVDTGNFTRERMVAYARSKVTEYGFTIEKGDMLISAGMRGGTIDAKEFEYNNSVNKISLYTECISLLLKK